MPLFFLRITRRLNVAALVLTGLLLCACALAVDGNGTTPAADATPASVAPEPVSSVPVEPAAAIESAAEPATPAVIAAIADVGYRLGAGDRISISVLGERDLSMELVVDDQGDINYPFIGELPVVGLSINDVRDEITEGLQPDYLLDPRVTVQVLEYRKFFVNGEVQKPGGFPWQSGMTVRKAVALAGGFTQRAARSRLVIIREADVAKRPVQVEIDAPVAPGDIITIDQSFF